MKLEVSLKHFSPQEMHTSDDVKGTSSDRLIGTDVMTAIDTTSSRARFDPVAFSGRIRISKSDKRLVVQALAHHAMESAPKNVRKAAAGEFDWYMLVFAQFIFAEYSRSAETDVKYHGYNGTGRTTREQITRKVSYPRGKAPYWASRSHAVRPSGWEHWAEVAGVVSAICDICKGKGIISAHYQCDGKGEVSGHKVTSERGVPVFKTCGCHSRNGFSGVPPTAAHKAILKRVPNLHIRTWTCNWRPFLERPADVCYREEQRADSAFQDTTSFCDDMSKI